MSKLQIKIKDSRLDAAKKVMQFINSINIEELPSYISLHKERLKALSNKKDNGNYILGDSPMISLLDRIGKKEFDSLSKEFELLASKQATLTECVKIFIHILKTNNIITYISIVIGSLDLFIEIVGKKKNPFITWQEISNFMLNHFNERRQALEFGITNKYDYKLEDLKNSLTPLEYSKVDL